LVERGHARVTVEDDAKSYLVHECSYLAEVEPGLRRDGRGQDTAIVRKPALRSRSSAAAGRRDRSLQDGWLKVTLEDESADDPGDVFVGDIGVLSLVEKKQLFQSASHF
jgi:hypothetical protein